MSDNSSKRVARTSEENANLFDFLVEESKKAKSPLIRTQLSKDFIEKSGISRTWHAVFQHIPAVLKKIYTMDNIDKETKVRMFFALSGQLNEEYLNELRKDAVVVVDKKLRITKYDANDGCLKLEGNHTSSARMEAAWETRRRRSGIPRDFQKEDVENIEEGNQEVMTQSGRISKKPHLYDYSSSNGTNEELMKFDGHDIHAQLQNEHIKIQNAGTSSKKDTIKRKLNAQISELTKKLKKMRSEGEAEPEEDVVYEGPKEPPRPALLLKKREPIEEPIVLSDDEEHPKEKKPDTLGFFGNWGNLKLEEYVDFGVSPEDAIDNVSTTLSEPYSINVSQRSSDSTNITKFLELLRSLVLTLESPKLYGLHENIDMKIRELGDQNLEAPDKVIPLALESVIRFVIKNATSTMPTEGSTSLKDFLLIFRTASYYLTSPECGDFQKALKEVGNQIGTEDKNVSFEKIQDGLEIAIKLVLP